MSLDPRFFRHQHGRLVGALVRRLGARHLDLAEEAASEAFARAARTWPLQGLPERPASWLYVVARNYAVDQLRRAAWLQERLPALVAPAADPTPADETLELTFMCCHPALSRRDQVALTLKAVAGLGTAQLAAAFLVPEATLAQRLVRAKRRLLEVGAELSLPDPEALPARLGAVLDVLYLAYTAGHQAQDGGAEGLGASLVDEVRRLGEALLDRTETARPEVHALLALVLLGSARFPARIREGAFVPLAAQDRGAWDRARLDAGLAHLARADRGPTLSSFHLLAGIEACHALAPSVADTDWPRIVGLYDDLLQLAPSPVLRLNRVVALHSPAGTPPRSRASSRPSSPTSPTTPLHAAQAELRLAAGDAAGARAAWERALTHAGSDPERGAYRQRLAAL
ncbi:MAG: DUF6596 domain-containing protein [Planctomycetota bacterium]